MAYLGVSYVFVQGGTAWCQVDCLRGALRVGDQLTAVTRFDGSTLPVTLTVEAIDLPSGPSQELAAPLTGRIRLTGTGVEVIQVGNGLGDASEWTGSDRPMPSFAGSAVWRALDAEERPKLVFVEPLRLNRVKTAFRIVLAIPQVVVLWLLTIVAYIVGFLGWFGALVMGRLPTWAGDYLTIFCQYQARVNGYLMLLTDEYPPFALSAAPYPLHLQLPPRGRLNRGAVLFRFVLVLPAAVAGLLVAIGWGVASLVVWLIVLITGRFPRPLFQVAVAVLRYSMRYQAYWWMLTRRYPRGLFGGEPGDEEYPIALTRDLEAAPAVAGSPAERLDLSTAAKLIVVVLLILGLAGFVADVKLNALARGREDHNQAVSELNAAEQDLAASGSTYGDAVATCKTASESTSCLEHTAEKFADELDDFRAKVDNIDPPAGTESLFADLSTKTADFADGFHQLADADGASEYTAVGRRLDLVTRGRAFDDANAALIAKLNE